MITVAELIEVLRTLPGDSRVVVDGYEGGVADIEAPVAKEVIPDPDRGTFYGKFSLVGSDIGDVRPANLGSRTPSPVVYLARVAN